MIFLNEDLISKDYDPYNESIEESLFEISESVSDFTENALNADIAMQEGLMQSIYLEAAGDVGAAIKNFFNKILEFVKMIWNKIKEFVGGIFTRIHMTSAKLIKIIDALNKDSKYADALNSTVSIKSAKNIFIPASVPTEVKEAKAPKMIGALLGKSRLIDGVVVNGIMSDLMESTKSINNIVKLAKGDGVNAEELNFENMAYVGAMIYCTLLSFPKAKNETKVQAGKFLNDYKNIATDTFEKDFKKLIKDLKTANKELENVAKEGIKSIENEDAAKLKKKSCRLIHKLVSSINKSIGKMVAVRSGYTSNTYKVIQAVRKKSK